VFFETSFWKTSSSRVAVTLSSINTALPRQQRPSLRAAASNKDGGEGEEGFDVALSCRSSLAVDCLAAV
jgi:hypothetical protein